MNGDGIARTLEAANKVPLVPLSRVMLAVGASEMGLSPVAGAFAATMRDSAQEVDPLPLDDLISLAEDCENPVLRALAAEACWYSRCGSKPYEFALAAVEGYRELASRPEWLLSDQAEFLVRQLTLAINLNDQSLARQAADALMTLLRRAVAEAPGRDSRALERLDPQLVFDDAPEADEALAERQFHDAGLFALRAFARHRQTPVLKVGLAWDEVRRCAVAAFDEAEGDRSLRTQLLDPVTTLHDDQMVRRSIVERHLRAEVAWARTQCAGTHYVILVDAERTARDVGLADLAIELQHGMQGLNRADILSAVRTEVAIDGVMVDTVVQDFLSQVFVRDDWRIWARNLVVVGGCPLMLTDPATEPRGGSVTFRPLGSALPTLTIGPLNVPVRTENDGQSLERCRAQQGQARLFASLLLIPGISEFLRRITGVDDDDLVMFFVSVGLDRVRAKHVVGALRTYGAGDVDAATHKVLPRIEYLLRERASAQASVIRPTDGTLRGGVDLLGAVLDALKGHIDEAWRRYLQFALVDDQGLNLRNDTLHGLRPELTESDAAIVFHVLLVCCFLDDLGAQGSSP